MKKICLILCLFLTISVSAREMAGKVVAIEGRAVARNPNRKDRTLSKGSPIMTGEKIVVGADSRVQIKFTDDAVLNLIPNSEYEVQNYSYGSKRTANTYLGEIFKGGFRHLTGKIAKENPEAVTIKGPTVTIGIRGTLIQAVIARGGAMFIGCEFGMITVVSPKGSISLGPTRKFQYSEISPQTLSPRGLTNLPASLSSTRFVPPRGGIPTIAPKPVAPATPKEGAPSRESTAPAPQAKEPAAPAETNTIKISGGC
ncbi:MAG: hypothetical protein COT85_00670 [Chlamydiae bacterium CG10_big_fil_rev_8_21_14_0_10_42_34]|nr:MAG: hypothetical protein COT85_00670 [Chlamydiae bacterium CG10_big_fil_rev_8_21_14_0_10_42_34]